MQDWAKVSIWNRFKSLSQSWGSPIWLKHVPIHMTFWKIKSCKNVLGFYIALNHFVSPQEDIYVHYMYQSMFQANFNNYMQLYVAKIRSSMSSKVRGLDVNRELIYWYVFLINFGHNILGLWISQQKTQWHFFNLSCHPRLNVIM